jgi:hypothetical protein
VPRHARAIRVDLLNEPLLLALVVHGYFTDNRFSRREMAMRLKEIWICPRSGRLARMVVGPSLFRRNTL